MKKEKDVRTSVKIAIIVVLKLKCVILTTFIKSWWRDIKRFIGTQIQANDAFRPGEKHECIRKNKWATFSMLLFEKTKLYWYILHKYSYLYSMDHKSASLIPKCTITIDNAITNFLEYDKL